MENLLFISYLVSAIAYSGLLLFALIQKKRDLAFITAVFFSILWSSNVVRATLDDHFFLADTLIYETLRNASWLFYSSKLLALQQHRTFTFHNFKRSRSIYFISLFIIFTISIETFPNFLDIIRSEANLDPRFVVHVIFAILGLIVSEQLYRNTPLSQRWHIKFFCLALGALYIVDLLVYSKSLLYQHLDITLWRSRGVINVMVTPLFAISLARLSATGFNPPLTIPRKTIFYTTVLFGSGLYLIVMSIAGYYLKQTNTEWGETLQILFIFLALLLLLISFTSGKIRALAKIYFSKHFFHYNYDYREEWLKISKALAQLQSFDDLKMFILNTLTNLVESNGGGLWIKDEQDQFNLVAQHNFHLTDQELSYLKCGHDLPNYLANKQWVIDFFELEHAPEVYEDIDLSPWCYEDGQVWLIVPLFHLNRLEAFAVLTQPRVPRKLNWEDHDLLKTVGMQLANAIALNNASEALASNKQFEAYHRLSAFLVHDLKNITAQLSLIVKNADRHRHKPDFFDDTIDTINNAVYKMRHIVEQLKQGRPTKSAAYLVNLVDLTQRTLQQNQNLPKPRLETSLSTCMIKADPAKMTSIIGNLVQNAQDATQNINNGQVVLTLTSEGKYAMIKIIDNGIGMDQTFIAERLFKPFDTTKGNAGMGIGAYEAKDYVLRIGGQLHVESQLGEGSIFTLQLPLIQSERYESN
ncbi:XrtA/PEP-CTERM system histidine kinase PrsK [Methylomonas sp. MgM2]